MAISEWAFASTNNARVEYNIRKVEFTAVEWPKVKGRTGVYEEEEKCLWDPLEKLYRDLKQNHEDRRDYARSGDFHFGEKEMRLRNPETPWWDKGLLWIYRVLSGYGERIWRPLIALGILILLCSLIYYFSLNSLAVRGGGAFFNTLLYSMRVSFLLRPDELELHGMVGLINLLQTIFSPILLGLLALAIRQRLKR